MKIRFLRENKNFGVRNCILCCRRLIENPTLTCSLPITLALPSFGRQPNIPWPKNWDFRFLYYTYHYINFFCESNLSLNNQKIFSCLLEPMRNISDVNVIWFKFSAPGVQAESLEAASLQLGALQAQAQYAPSALQGARAASRSAASCLVTAVQYTHGQQVHVIYCIDLFRKYYK